LLKYLVVSNKSCIFAAEFQKLGQMKRYTQEKIGEMPINDILKLSQEGKCQLDEKRVIVKETYDSKYRDDKEYTLFVVKFCYTLVLPETWIYEREVYYLEKYDDVSFNTQKEAEKYIDMVYRPSTPIDDRSYQAFIKDEYADIIGGFVDKPWHVRIVVNDTNNHHRSVKSGSYGFYVGGFYECQGSDIDSMIHTIKAIYGCPKDSKNVAEISEKQYKTVDLDNLIRDVEELKNEKNKFIVNEIDRSTQYILTLKKLL